MLVSSCLDLLNFCCFCHASVSSLPKNLEKLREVSFTMRGGLRKFSEKMTSYHDPPSDAYDDGLL